MTFAVRRLEAGDAGRYRDIRLEALAAAPTAFGGDVPHETAFAAAVWVERLQEDPTFGVFAGDELVGIATLVRLGASSASTGPMWSASTSRSRPAAAAPARCCLQR